MSLTNEQLAELLAGIARSQQAIIDAIDRAEPGFKNNHLVPVLTSAANTRAAVGRLIDLPSRILLRSQGRTAMDVATVLRDFEAALVAPEQSEVPFGAPAGLPPAAARVAARAAAAAGGAAPAAAPAAAAPRPAAPAAGGDDDMDFTAKS